jgi:hypothetical protein
MSSTHTATVLRSNEKCGLEIRNRIQKLYNGKVCSVYSSLNITGVIISGEYGDVKCMEKFSHETLA